MRTISVATFARQMKSLGIWGVPAGKSRDFWKYGSQGAGGESPIGPFPASAERIGVRPQKSLKMAIPLTVAEEIGVRWPILLQDARECPAMAANGAPRAEGYGFGSGLRGMRRFG
jgi:hypothetical protein